MHLDLVAADEQPKVRHANRFQCRRPEQRAVEQRRDAGQQILAGLGAQLADPSAPDQAAAQREGQSLRVVGIAHHRRHLGQLMLVGAGQQRGQHLGRPAGGRRRRPATPSRAPSASACSMPSAKPPAPPRFRRDRDRWSESVGRQPDRAPAVVVVEIVVDHDQLVGRPALGAQHVERLGQFVGAPVGDHDGAHHVTHRRGLYSRARRVRFRRAPRARAGRRPRLRTRARRLRCRRSS